MQYIHSEAVDSYSQVRHGNSEPPIIIDFLSLHTMIEFRYLLSIQTPFTQRSRSLTKPIKCFVSSYLSLTQEGAIPNSNHYQVENKYLPPTTRCV